MSLPHDFAHTHVAGKSEFIDDRAKLPKEVYADVIYSTRAHAKILSCDFSQAMSMEGVLGYFTHKDFAHNLWGTIFKDQPILASDIVQYAGEPIAILVATSPQALAKAIRAVKIHYEDLPAILSIRDAIEKKSFIIDARKIECGNFDQALKTAKHKISGTIVMQGHDHFYLESQACIAYPLEDNQFEIHSSTQHAMETQHVVAHALGIPLKDVVCQVKRLGGGFGGKESQAAPFAAMACLAAQKLQRPVRLCLTKDDDMIMTGKRNPFENDYEVGFDAEGKVLALKVHLYSDAGAYADLSTSIMERAMLHCDNAYYIPNAKIIGQVCKTNHHSHTAFRGFGGPKGVATIEKIMDEIAHTLNLDPLEVRKKNLYGTAAQGNSITHYGQKFENNCLREILDKLEKSSDYKKRRAEIIQHNSKGSDISRGISITFVKFGISFTTRFLNQANALVIIHTDGTIQISTGAIEMGQGVNARIAEIVTSELSIPRNFARVMPTRTDKNANTSPTAASSATDLNGAASLLATKKIKDRLSKFAAKLLRIPKEHWPSKTAGLGTQREITLDQEANTIVFKEGLIFDSANPENTITFKDLVLEAYLSRISLSDYAFYKIDGIEFNKMTGHGTPFLYFTQGAACSEVSINNLSGEVKVLRTDIVMDLGKPINEQLDLGQITGAFVQGMGWVTTENLVYNDQGMLLSHAPSTYKIPSVQDMPRIFNVELIENNGNTVNLKGTKAVGEPPLLLAISVWSAINNALCSKDHFKKAFPQLKIPATSENVLRQLYPKEFLQWDQP